MSKNNYTPQSSGIFPTYTRLVQHLKINLCNPTSKPAREGTASDHVKRCRKSICQNPTPILDKNY